MLILSSESSSTYLIFFHLPINFFKRSFVMDICRERFEIYFRIWLILMSSHGKLLKHQHFSTVISYFLTFNTRVKKLMILKIISVKWLNKKLLKFDETDETVVELRGTLRKLKKVRRKSQQNWKCSGSNIQVANLIFIFIFAKF